MNKTNKKKNNRKDINNSRPYTHTLLLTIGVDGIACAKALEGKLTRS